MTANILFQIMQEDQETEKACNDSPGCSPKWQVSDLLTGQAAKEIWSDLGTELNVLFEGFPQWETPAALDALKEIVKRYYNAYEIYISNTDKGVYYDIPVKFQMDAIKENP